LHVTDPDDEQDWMLTPAAAAVLGCTGIARAARSSPPNVKA